MAKKTSKKTFELKMLVPEDNKKDTGTRYYVRKPTKGEKRGMKMRVRKYDPVVRKHVIYKEDKIK